MDLGRGFTPWFFYRRPIYANARFYVQLLWFFRDDLKRDFGQHRQNRLLDDRVRREDHGVELDRASLPRYPDPLNALTVFIRFHNFCLGQEVIEVVVGRQPDTILLLQEIAGRGERARDDYCGFVARDINRRTKSIDAQPAF